MGCIYCENIFSIPSRSAGDLHNCALFESEHFVAVPTVGSLVEGWLLVITKDHYLCMGAMPQGMFEELDRFKHLVARAVEDCYGPVAIFEHGPSEPKQVVGCGIDHAHLHIVPVDCDLVRGLRDVMAVDLRWAEVDGVWDTSESYIAGLEYLYVEQPLGRARLTSSRGFESQVFRQVVARHIGTPDRYDWKLYGGAENVRRTVDRLAPWPNRKARAHARSALESR
jgi:ATP adenylyltransferase